MLNNLRSAGREPSREAGGLIICADKGLDHALAAGLTPDMIVGDFDSANSMPPEGIRVIRTIPEKDDTDTILGLRGRDRGRLR